MSPMMKRHGLLALLTVLAAVLLPAQSRPLFNKKNLDGWDVVGNGIWTVLRDGTLLGQRDYRLPETSKQTDQSWLYTKEEFGEYDLHIEWWTRLAGNSGISIRDSSRGSHSFGENADREKTPSHIGYEIQISNGYRDEYPTGSVYLFAKAKTGVQIPNEWNSFDIESRNDMIRVRLNGQLVSEHPGDPARSKRGPIGLQLHDRQSIVMFRNIRIRLLP